MAKTATVSMLDLRNRAEEIVERVRNGEALVLTYRGRPALRLEPIRHSKGASDDPFYRLPELASPRGASLSNRQIDDAVYGT